ncbi:MAG: hypothetical protein MUC96_11500 [Myxococcaceae bacterium]|nr:hypothetical protein [Myxococcaceae bacterium]
MSDPCDHCGKEFENLHVMQHVPGLNIGKYFRPQLWCDSCAGVGPGETPPCPPSMLRPDGSCTVCEPMARVG